MASLGPPAGAGSNDSGGIRHTTSPGRPNGSRLVASTRSWVPPVSRRAISSAEAPGCASQVSRISSICRPDA